MTTNESHSEKKLHRKLWRVLRHEGVAGLVARVIYPKHPGLFGPTPPIRLPIAPVGGSPEAREIAAAALRQLGIEVAEGGTRLHLSPDPSHSYDENDAIILSDADKAGRVGDLVRGAAAVFVSDAANWEIVHAAGVEPGRLFIGGVQPDALARWLIAAGQLSPDQVDPLLFSALNTLEPGARICLSLPETTSRRAAFLRHIAASGGQGDFALFDGIRQIPGWLGAGWSHVLIARAAHARGVAPLLVCEDDMLPPANFECRLSRITSYLDGTEWDIFSGLLSDIHPAAHISRVERRDGLTFVHLDYCMGMVCNLYGPRALAHLARWSPVHTHAETETVDVWLSQMPGLRVVTTLPFLVGHDISATSTVFGFSNRRYHSLIRSSEKRLAQMVARFEREGRR